MNTIRNIALKYLALLELGNLEELLGLFARDAVVSSPVYGNMPAREFYRELMNDTRNSKILVKGVFENREARSIALYFNYTWTMKHEEVVEFDVVDILEFNSSNAIQTLTIIYDSARAREAINRK